MATTIERNTGTRGNSTLRYLHYYFIISISFLELGSDILLLHNLALATSINYGISQQPITDMNQLMPILCQNQSVICEGSFCIPGVKKCVCDLRMPVQISRFCLRQIDIETKCFATNQCNHTVKDAVCVDINSRVALDLESSKFKLEQWHQLHELKKSSQSTVSKETPQQFQQLNKNREIVRNTVTLLLDNKPVHGWRVSTAQGSVIPDSARNSPYEISYDTPELLHQNHTRRRTNSSDRSDINHFLNLAGSVQSRAGSVQTTDSSSPSIASLPEISTALPQTTTQSESTTSFPLNSPPTSAATTSQIVSRLDQSSRDSTYSDAVNRKKTTVKTTSWPPGICSCPKGFMFDSMLRKCLALSLADSHCQVDTDCKQIVSSHCSPHSRKCECDEPFVWDLQELACTRPKQPVRTSEGTTSHSGEEKSSGDSTSGSVNNLLPPLILAKLMPDYTMMLAIFVVIVIVGTLLLLRISVKCFSSNNSALISPKNKKKKPNNNQNPSSRSPYATLRRPDHHKQSGSHLSSFTQATRGRILNYDFEQESPKTDRPGSSPSSSAMHNSATLRPLKTARPAGIESSGKQYSATLRSTPRGHKHHNKEDSVATKPIAKSVKKKSIDDAPLELNDNISIGDNLESESKSESSNIVLPPGPPATQQPPYMLKQHPMMGQSSAIAAAAAAVANKRLQKKNFDQQQQLNGRVTGESPVFL